MIIKTNVFKLNGDNPDFGVVSKAADILKEGGILAVPTETVYGLGADATSPDCASKIYSAKGRPSDNPLIVHIGNIDNLEYVAYTSDIAYSLAESFWPGPLTIILPKKDVIPKETTGGLDTVAVRMPRPYATRAIINTFGKPVAAPSANISGRPSPTSAKHVLSDFDGRIEGVVDCGDCVIGIESTIVDICGNTPRILRRGYILPEAIEKVLGTGVMVVDKINPNEAPPAPGMKYRHYSPKAKLTLVDGDRGAAKNKIIDLIRHQDIQNANVGIICSEETKDSYQKSLLNARIYSLGSFSDGKSIMQKFYKTLRLLDEDKVEVAYSEPFYDNEYGQTIMERLKRACGEDIVKV